MVTRLRSAPFIASTLTVVALGCAIVPVACGRAPVRLAVRGTPSLDTVVSDLARMYCAENPDVEVTSNCTCPICVVSGTDAETPYDIWIAWGSYELDRLVDEGRLRLSYTRAVGSTALAIATSAELAAEVRSLEDLRSPLVRNISIGHPESSAVGHYARQALVNAGMWDELADRLVFSRSGCETLRFLALGRDADAAIVFSACRGDGSAALSIADDLPPEIAPRVPLIAAVSASATHPNEARRFVDFLASDTARPVLERHDIGPAESSG